MQWPEVICCDKLLTGQLPWLLRVTDQQSQLLTSEQAKEKQKLAVVHLGNQCHLHCMVSELLIRGQQVLIMVLTVANPESPWDSDPGQHMGKSQTLD